MVSCHARASGGRLRPLSESLDVGFSFGFGLRYVLRYDPLHFLPLTHTHSLFRAESIEELACESPSSYFRRLGFPPPGPFSFSL